MRKNYINALAFVALIAVSCKKEISVKSVEFDASATKSEYSLQEQAVFNLKGNPDLISFYSGLPGSRYEFRNRTSAEGKPVLSFTTARNAGVQTNSLTLLVSSNFAGVNKDNVQTVANISLAKWEDITSKANIATGTAATPSGDIDLSNLPEKKGLYFAFKFNGVKGTLQNKWTITALSIVNRLSDETNYTIANLSANTGEIINYGAITYSPGWVSSISVGKVGWVISAGTSLVITGAAANSTDDSEAYVIMGPVDLRKVSPDRGLPIKKQTEDMSAFPYKFTYPAGDFKPTFVAKNSSRDEQKEAVRVLNIKVKKQD